MPRYQALIAEFPDQAMAILRAILSDTDFAAVCDDYLSCLAAIDHWQNRSNPDGRVEDYQRTLTEIKIEIADYLAHPPCISSKTGVDFMPTTKGILTRPEPPANMEKH